MGTAWDLLIIGGGTAGIVAAKTAAGFGASALLVERDRTGGDCLWTGCVPSKALLAAAHAAADARAAARLGVHVDSVRVDFAEVMAHVRGAITAIEPADAPAALRAEGVRVVHGTARLGGPDTAVVDGTTITFRQALLATGSTPVMLPIPGLADCRPLTSDTVWELTALPGRLLVIGGGSIGCELGQAFARLGSKVTVAEAATTILSREDPVAATLLHAALTRDGVEIRTGAAVAAVACAAGVTTVSFDNGETVDVDAVLVAVGRSPDTGDLGLAGAGVDLDERGYVVVNDRLQTTNARIWAAGDLTGHPQFTHVAGVHASTAAANAILGLRRTVDTATIPRVTYTQPEIAAFGVSGEQARSSDSLRILDISHREVDRAIAEDATGGITRLIADRKGHLVGATIVGPRAGESLAETRSRRPSRAAYPRPRRRHARLPHLRRRTLEVRHRRRPTRAEATRRSDRHDRSESAPAALGLPLRWIPPPEANRRPFLNRTRCCEFCRLPGGLRRRRRVVPLAMRAADRAGLPLGDHRPGPGRDRTRIPTPAAAHRPRHQPVHQRLLRGVHRPRADRDLIRSRLVANQTTITRIAGLLLLAFALFILGSLVLQAPWLYQEKRFHPTLSRFGPFAAPIAGAAFGFGWTPCIGPILGSVLAVAATSGHAAEGGLLLASYSAGLGLPFLATGLAFGRLTTAFSWVRRHFGAITIASAVSLAFFGILLTLNRLTWVTSQLQTALGHVGLRGLVSLG